jgi:3-oxoacyl-[acyl-carrier protein] reductase
MLLKNKNIILTGAGRGIGREIAKKLALEGANIVLISRTEKELKETIEQLVPINDKTFHLVLDISNLNQVNKKFSEIIERFEIVNCLINNAAIQHPIGAFRSVDLFEWKRNFIINFFGAVYCTHSVLGNMIKSKKGKIINFSGGGATSPRPNFSAYGVSKTAVLRFTETVAYELKEFNIDINAIAPGIINTKMLDEIIGAGNKSGNELKQAVEKKAIGGDDINKVTDLVTFLCSDLSDGISGKLISAHWDPWDEETFIEKLKNEKDFATLRRIDNKSFFAK